MKVVFSPTFQRQAFRLERGDARLIGLVLNKIQDSDVPLGKRLSGVLHNCYSIRTGLNHRLRLVYEIRTNEATILVAGPRERGLVYIQAIEVLKELER